MGTTKILSVLLFRPIWTVTPPLPSSGVSCYFGDIIFNFKLNIFSRLTSEDGRKIKTESFLVVPNDSLTTVYELTFCELGYGFRGLRLFLIMYCLKKTKQQKTQINPNYYTFNVEKYFFKLSLIEIIHCNTNTNNCLNNRFNN